MRFAPLQRFPAHSSSTLVGFASPVRLRPQVFSTSRRVSNPLRACQPCFMLDPLMGLHPSELCSHRVAVRRFRRRSPHGVGPCSFPPRRPAPAHALGGRNLLEPEQPLPFHRGRSSGGPNRRCPSRQRRSTTEPNGHPTLGSRSSFVPDSGSTLRDRNPFEPDSRPSSSAPKRNRTVRPPDPSKPSTEVDRPVGRDALPSARRSEDRRPLDIGPLLVDPKIPADRTVRSPLRDPRASSGSSDSTRTPLRPKPYWDYEGCSPKRGEPKLLSRRTSQPLCRCPKAPVSRSTPPSALRPEGRTVSSVRSDLPHQQPKKRRDLPALSSRGPKSLRILSGTEVPSNRAPPLGLPGAEAPFEPNERLRWPRELPHLQGFDPRGDPPLTCRLFRPARGA